MYTSTHVEDVATDEEEEAIGSLLVTKDVATKTLIATLTPFKFFSFELLQVTQRKKKIVKLQTQLKMKVFN